MKKIKFFSVVSDICGSSKFYGIGVFVLFALLFTILLSAKYFLFQTIISSEGISIKDVVAPKNIVVTDVFKTEQLKKEVAQKISPILTPAEDSYIRSNLSALEKSVQEIRKKDTTRDMKKTELTTLFDIEDSSRKQMVINYLLTARDSDIEVMFKKSSQTLNDILDNGVTEEDFNTNIDRIIFKSIKRDISRNKIVIISSILEQVIVPNLVIDEKATTIAKQNAIDSVKPVTVTFEKGSKIVFKGEPVTKLKRDALNKAGYNVLDFNAKGFLSIFAFVAIGIVSLVYYIYFFDKNYLTKKYFSIIAILTTFMASLAIILPDGWSAFYLPFPALAMLLTMFLNSKISVITSIILLSIIGISMQFPAPIIVIFMMVVIVSSIAAAGIKYTRRVDIIKTGTEISLIMAFIVISSYLLQSCVSDLDLSILKEDVWASLVNGVFSGMIVLGIIPVLESVVGIITPYGLAEFGEHSHPLLKRLQEFAPGTFAHSLAVSNLCEAIAEGIGADPILAKVGALYHDVGKLKRPFFFVENQNFYGIENKHKSLNPRLSKMIITAHTRDGIDIAKEYGIPPIIHNFIIQHHGTCLAGHFYTQAVEAEGIENVEKEQFRYAGPKPNMKETAILMIADAVESASRTLKEVSEEELENIINKIITDRLNDGQLSDSPMTLKDLKTTTQILKKHIRAAHHERIQYNVLDELEAKLENGKVADPSVLTDTKLEDKIEKKIEKRRMEVENNETKS